MFRLSSLALAFCVFYLVYGAYDGGCYYSRGNGRSPDKVPCPSDSIEDGDYCWLHMYGRGVGRISDKAPCPPGLRDDGLSCWNDAHIYGKGCCCTFWNDCCGKCRSGYNDDGCTCRKTGVGIKLNLFQRQSCRSNEDKYGALCYPKCRSGYRSVGCCICEPSGGLAFVEKKQKDRRCRSGEDMYENKCYPKCRTGDRAIDCCLCDRC